MIKVLASRNEGDSDNVLIFIWMLEATRPISYLLIRKRTHYLPNTSVGIIVPPTHLLRPHLFFFLTYFTNSPHPSFLFFISITIIILLPFAVPDIHSIVPCAKEQSHYSIDQPRQLAGDKLRADWPKLPSILHANHHLFNGFILLTPISHLYAHPSSEVGGRQ